MSMFGGKNVARKDSIEMLEYGVPCKTKMSRQYVHDKLQEINQRLNEAAKPYKDELLPCFNK
eukprot:scaffold125902_cov55-Attheya_sp.AAC.1